MKIRLLFMIVMLKFRLIICPSASLSSSTVLEGSICPTTVRITCMITDLPALRWIINDNSVASYLHTDGDTFPITLSSPPGIEITVTSAAPDNVNRDLFDATSTLTTNTTLLQAFNMHNFTCGNFETMSEPVTVNLINLGPPLTSIATCSLVTSAIGLNVSLQWSSSFNSQHAVERYRVSVDPDPSSSCSSDQVMPSEDYSCPGLSPQRNYSITVSAINCGDQEGENNTFTVLPQLLGPQSPGGATVVSDTVIDGGLIVFWIESVTTSGNCSFFGAINYTLILEDSTGEVVEERVVSSDSSCSNGNCSSSFSPSSQICRVSIMANNTFGESNPAIAIRVPDRLSTSNQVLLTVGVVLLCVAIGVGILILLILKIKTKVLGTHIVPVMLVMLVVGVVMIAVSVVLWVALGFQVGLQDNTCDSTWQLTRGNLIISAFVFSLLCTILIVMFAAVIYIDVKKSIKIKGSKEQEQTELGSFPRGPGGRVAKLETGLYDEHSARATSITNARLKVQEERFMEYDSKVSESSLYSTTQQPNTVKQQMPTLEPAIYSHLDTESGRDHEEYALLTHGKTEIGASSVNVQPEEYGQLLTHHMPLCVTMSQYAQKRNTLPEQVAAWFPLDRKWLIEDLSENTQLKVYFMNKCPSEWKFCKKKISHKVIIKMLQESWSGCFVHTKTLKKNPQIRVEFQGQSDGNWSAIGREAKLIDPPKPTIVLNFSNMGDDDIKATVLHQFGHALGLGHALMKPADWKALKQYVNTDSMMRSYGVSKEKNLEVQWTGEKLNQSVVNYDEESVMGYSFDPVWQKVNTSKLPDNVKKLPLHKRQTNLSIKDNIILKAMKLAPPRYTLECDSIIDVANESLKIGFTVTSEHPMPSNPEHTIIREDGGTVRCKIEGQFIIFSKLDVRDSGRYTISCCNVNKCEGKETFELDVTPVPPKYFMKFDHVEAVAGESPVVHFSVTTEPHTLFPKHIVHTVTRRGEDVSSLFIIKKDSITLPHAKASDSGNYEISCCDDNGVKGKKTFSLKIKHGSPKYTLDFENVEALEGESLQMNFSMEPQLPSSTRHTVARTDGKKCTDKNRSHLFKIKKGDTITFPSVRVSDTGTYVISCQNSDGVEGKKNFKLNIKPASPKYTLDSENMEAVEGESLQIKFSVEPQLPDSIRHTVSRTDGKKYNPKIIRSNLFKIKEDTITFPAVRVSDTGTYAISCRNSDGVEGKKTFKLNIKPVTKQAEEATIETDGNTFRPLKQLHNFF